MRLKKKEAVIFGSILLIALIWWGVQTWVLNRTAYGSIRITCRGRSIGEYSLGKDAVINIGDTNVCEIKDGVVRMISADCPDKLCMYQPAIDSNSHGSLIVCLPNAVVIEGCAAGKEFSPLPDPSENSGVIPDAVAF